MPFCTRCGKKLEDGEACSCQTEIKEAAGQEEEKLVQDSGQVLRTEEADGQEQQAFEVSEQDVMSDEAKKEKAEAGIRDSGQSAPGAAYQGHPNPGVPYPGQPAAGTPYPGQPGTGAPYQGHLGSGAPYQGQPGSGAPYKGQMGPGAPYPGQPGPGPYQGGPYQGYNGQYHRQPGAFSTAVSGAWKVFIGGLKNPDTIKQFTAKGDLKEGMLLLGVESVLMAFYALVVVLRALSGSPVGLGGVIFLIFFSILIASYGINIAFAAVFMPIYHGISKQPVSFGQSVCCVAAKTMAVLPFLAGGILFGIFSLLFSFMITGLGTILGYFFFFIGMKGVTRANDSQLTYAAFLGFLVNNVITIVIYAFVILGIGSTIFGEMFKSFSFLF